MVSWIIKYSRKCFILILFFLQTLFVFSGKMHAVPCMIKGQYVIRWILVIKMINDYYHYDNNDNNKEVAAKLLYSSRFTITSQRTTVQVNQIFLFNWNVWNTVFWFIRALPVILNIVTIIIIITRPMPAYGRQGLAVSWGQNTDEVSTFLVFLTSHFAPAALSSDLNQPGTIKIHLESWKPDLEP